MVGFYGSALAVEQAGLGQRGLEVGAERKHAMGEIVHGAMNYLSGFALVAEASRFHVSVVIIMVICVAMVTASFKELTPLVPSRPISMGSRFVHVT